MSHFELRTLKEIEYPLWDELVEKSGSGTLFQSTVWLKASNKLFAIYGYFKGNELFAGIPLVVKTKYGIKQGVLPPCTTYSGIIFKQNEAKYCNRLSNEKVISREIARGLKENFQVIQFNFAPGFVDLQPFIWENFLTGVRYTYIINLDKNLQEIFMSMDDTKRRNIRKAEKDGVYVLSSDDFEKMFLLVDKTFKRQNLNTNFKTDASRYNESLRTRKQCKSFISLQKDGDAIAAVYIVWDSKRSYYLLGGYNANESNKSGVTLAMWEAIKFTKQELGLKEFDFEGSMVPQIEQSFRNYGGTLTPYYSLQWLHPSLRIVQLLRNQLI